MFFLNSLIPFPNDPAISGIRFAPKSSRITRRIIMISVKPICPNIAPSSRALRVR